MVLSKTLLLLFIIFLFSKIIFPQEYPQKEIDALLKSGIESIVNQDYDEAAKIFFRLDRNYPEIPLGKIYSAAVEIAKSYDYGADFNSEFINEKLDQAVKDSDKLLEENPEYTWNIYFFALAEGYYCIL